MEQKILNICLIDHEFYRAESLRRGLKLAGHNVSLATSLREAVEALQCATRAMDVIITDSTSPLALDSEVGCAIREFRGQVPVLMMTSSVKDDRGTHPLWPCCAGLIEKPFVLEQLLTMIASLTATHPRRAVGD